MFKRKKWADVDFTTDKMPSSRPQVFFDVYKNRFSTMLLLGLVLLLFCLPAIIAAAIFNVKIYEIRLSFSQGAISEIEFLKNVAQLENGKNVFLILGFFFVFLGVCGAFEVLRRLVWQEGLFFGHDFFKGVKDGVKSSAICALVSGLLNYAANATLNLSSASEDFAVNLATAAAFGGLVIALSLIPFIFTQSTIYDLPFSHKVKNAFLLSMRTAYISIPLALLYIAPIVILNFVGNLAYFILLATLPILFYTPLVLVNILYCDSVLDEYVNKENFPQIYKKGIYQDGKN